MEPTQSKKNSAIDLLEFLIVLRSKKKLFLRFGLAGLLLGTLAAVFLPSKYSAKAVVMPPQQGQQSMMVAMMSQVGGLGALGGGALGLKNPNDQYLGFLGSRNIVSDVTKQFGLDKRYQAENMDEAVEIVGKHTNVKSTKDGMITIAYVDSDPQLAARVANGYVVSLQRLLNNIAVSNAAKKRTFFERETRAAKDSLSKAEMQMKEFQKNSGIIEVGAQMEGTMGAMASVRAEIGVREVQIQAMRTYLSPDHPQIRTIQNEIAGLKSQIKELTAGAPQDSGVVLSLSHAPDAGMAYIRKKRDVMYFQALFEILAKQYEIARIEEANESAPVQVIDSATVPMKPAGLPRPGIAVVILVGSLLAGLLVVFFQQAIKEARAIRESHEAEGANG
ncbi:MAG: hypothetical protein IPK50_00090 [Fibrobacterota bacterium]|nr:MAG: hypothetical protein IPK50_00090 [Fibrobacterota bacterium]